MKKKHYIIIIGILVVLNIFSWRIWWESPARRNTDLKELFEKGRGRRGGGVGFFEQKLQLTPEQKQTFEKLKKSYFTEVESVKDSMSSVRKALIRSIGSEDAAKDKAIMFNKMAGYKLSIEKLAIDHFSALRRACNEEQKILFDTLLVKMMEHSPMFEDGGRSHGKHKRGEGKKDYQKKE